MIQRIQTLFLVLAIVSQSMLMSLSHFYTGSATSKGVVDKVVVDFNNANFDNASNGSNSTIFDTLTQTVIPPLNVLIVVLMLVAIFMFRKRMRQLVLTRLIALLLLVFIVLEAVLIGESRALLSKPVTDSFGIGAFLPLISLVLVMMAARGIKKDEELVRSADRLR